jgi:hypothetical protein
MTAVVVFATRSRCVRGKQEAPASPRLPVFGTNSSAPGHNQKAGR